MLLRCNIMLCLKFYYGMQNCKRDKPTIAMLDAMPAPVAISNRLYFFFGTHIISFGEFI